MTLYTAILFLHLAGSLVLFAALAIEWIGIDSLHRANSVEQVHLALRLAGIVPRLAGPSAALILFSGGYLSANIAAWRQGWVQVALLTVVLVAIVGIALSGRRMRALHKIQIEPTGTLPPVLRLRLQDSLLFVSVCLRSALLLGIVFLMAAKPGFGESLVAISCSAILGLIFASVTWNQRQKLPSTA